MIVFEKAMRMPERKRWIFSGTLLILTLLRIWLTAAQTMSARPSLIYDDMLFLEHAISLIRGHWLGAYDQNTLVKGAFYPIFVAAAHLTGLPLLFIQQLLFVFACVVFLVAIRPFVRSRAVLAVCYAVFLFNPGSYTSMSTGRVVRDFVCGSLAFLAVACMVAVFLRFFAGRTIRLAWPVVLGLAFAGVWLTREDSIWLLPVLAVPTMLCVVLAVVRQRGRERLRVVAVLLLPFLIFGACNALIAGANAYAYGIFITNEYAEPHFLGAYSALCRIDAGKWIPRVPVSKAARTEAYAVSPAFRELEPYLDGGKIGVFLDGNGEMVGTLFTWNLRNAVAAAGYYKTPAAAIGYYKRLTNELNRGFASGTLKSYPKTISLGMLSPWRSQYLQPTVQAVLDGLRYDVTFRDCSPYPEQSDPSLSGMALYQAMTYDLVNVDGTAAAVGASPLYPEAFNLAQKRLALLERITKAYQAVFPWLFALALLGYLYLTVRLVLLLCRRKKLEFGAQWLISTGIFLTFLLRVGIFAYGTVCTEMSFTTQYMVSAYFQMMMFTLFTLATVAVLLRKQTSFLRAAHGGPSE